MIASASGQQGVSICVLVGVAFAYQVINQVVNVAVVGEGDINL